MTKPIPTLLKQNIYQKLYQLCRDKDSFKTNASALFDDDCEFRISYPVNEHIGIHAAQEKFYAPLYHAFPDLERRDSMFIGGYFKDTPLIAAMGHYLGVFREDFLGIPATGRLVFIRYGEVYRLNGDKINQATILVDILDVMRQAGFWPIAPSLGTEYMWPAPITGDGIVLHENDAEESLQSIRQTLAMHKTLGDYAMNHDEKNAGRDGLLKMPQIDHWHENMMWFGPSGIGSTRSLQGFVDYHQLPFRLAFPNRHGGAQCDDNPEAQKVGGGHYIQVGDGHFSVTGGWPSVVAYHKGPNFLGLPATDKFVTMRVMDFYNHHEGKIRENWIPLDMLHLLDQMGVDVFDRMQSFFKRGKHYY